MEETPESQIVLTLPEPGESSTDELDSKTDDKNSEEETEAEEKNNDDVNNVTASIEEAGQKLGGMANVAFESEEFEAKKEDLDDATDTSIKMVSNGKMHTLPAIFFIHGVGGSANVWCHQLNFFANLGHEVFAPDLLGKVT